MTFKRYVAILLLLPLLGIVGLIVAVQFFHAALPAPHLSSSTAFNEKAKWLRTVTREPCDTLVVGSSMAFNNLKASELPESVFGKKIVNVASWGVYVTETRKMIDIVAPLCRPRNIVFLTNFTDFGASDYKQIDWRLFDDYVNAANPLLPYLENFDLGYFLSARKALKQSRRDGGRVYSSMEWDGTGTVNFACEGFNVSPRRWDGYRYQPPFTPGDAAAGLAALEAIAVSARRNGQKLFVLVSPLRAVAEAAFMPAERERLWRDARSRVEAQGGAFVRIAGSKSFGDTLFADYAHLNGCGADRFTREAMTALQTLPAGPASR